MTIGRDVHGWLSRNLFIPWVVHGPWTPNRIRFGKMLTQARAGFRAWERLDPERRREWTLRELRSLVRWAGSRVPYYRQLFREIGFDPAAEFTFSDYRGLPALDKDTVRNRAADLIADGYSRDSMSPKATGGSTGVPVRVWLDERTLAWGTAASEWAFSKVGLRPGDRLGLIWGAYVEPSMEDTLRARVVNWLAHQQPNDCFRLDPSILDGIHSRLSSYRPDFLRCYSAALATLACRLKTLSVKPDYPLRGIVTGAEKLSDAQRADVEAVFAVPVFESYGSRECGLMAMQLSSTDRCFQVAGAEVLIEPLEPPQPVVGCEIVVTLLHRYGMPFLRYRIGDTARPRAGDADGGLHLLEEITGRTLDYIRLPDGGLIHGIEFPHFFKDFDVYEYQVFQDSTGAVRVSIVGGPSFCDADLARVRGILSDNFRGAPLTVAVVPTIERTEAGKLRPVVSRLQTDPAEDHD